GGPSPSAFTTPSISPGFTWVAAGLVSCALAKANDRSKGSIFIGDYPLRAARQTWTHFCEPERSRWPFRRECDSGQGAVQTVGTGLGHLPSCVALLAAALRMRLR